MRPRRAYNRAQRLSDAEMEQVVRRWQTEPLARIAADLGVTKQALSARLRRLGIVPPARAGWDTSNGETVMTTAADRCRTCGGTTDVDPRDGICLPCFKRQCDLLSQALRESMERAAAPHEVDRLFAHGMRRLGASEAEITGWQSVIDWAGKQGD